MKYVLSVAVILMITALCATPLVDLNFFIEPEFELDFDVENLKQSTVNDTISQINIAAGRIFRETVSDSLLLYKLDLLEIDYASPVDFRFGYNPEHFNTQIIAANVLSDSLSIQRSIIIPLDGYTIGITSVYTPDYAVKFPIDDKAQFRFDIFDVAQKQSQYLSHFADLVILLSNAGLYIDRDLAENLPVDVMLSFDYQSYNNRTLNRGRTNYYSHKSDTGKFGKLRVIQINDELHVEWSVHQFK